MAGFYGMMDKVLICNEGADDALHRRAYFDEIVTCKQLFDQVSPK
jgi:hypothetical protein